MAPARDQRRPAATTGAPSHPRGLRRGLPDDVKDAFQRTLEDGIDGKRYGIDGKRYRLENRAKMKTWMMRSIKWTDGCIIVRCLAELHKQSGAELVLLIALTGSGTSFGYVVTLVRTDTGHVVDQESDRCDVCTVSEVTKNATLAAINVLNNVPDSCPTRPPSRPRRSIAPPATPEPRPPPAIATPRGSAPRSPSPA